MAGKKANKIVLAENGGTLVAREAAALALIEEKVYRDSLDVYSGICSFMEIDADAVAPPAEWIADIGEKNAWKKFRVAKSAWLGSQNAPTALKLIANMVAGMARARSSQTTLDNVQKMQMVVIPMGEQQQYPVVKVKE